MNDKVEVMPPQPTWFFEGADGKPFAVNEKEAFELLTNRSQWRRKDLKMLGCSDGTTFYNILKTADSKARELNDKIKEMKVTLNKYIAGHDKLLFEEFAEPNDPRLLRAKKLIDDLQAQIDPIEAELKSLRSDLISTAFNAELAQARGNIKNPRDFSVITKAGSNPSHNAALQNFANAKRVI